MAVEEGRDVVVPTIAPESMMAVGRGWDTGEAMLVVMMAKPKNRRKIMLRSCEIMSNVEDE